MSTLTVRKFWTAAGALGGKLADLAVDDDFVAEAKEPRPDPSPGLDGPSVKAHLPTARKTAGVKTFPRVARAERG
jgi:hypothetical protein